jgi:hypothetical protein
MNLHKKLETPDLPSDQRDAIRKELTETLEQAKLTEWWEKEGLPNFNSDVGPINAANLYGSRMALRWTAAVPAVMAVLYLLLIIYFRATGGYKAVAVDEKKE